MGLLKRVSALLVVCTFVSWGVIEVSHRLGVMAGTVFGGVLITTMIYQAMVFQTKIVAEKIGEM